ncbi:hypothetical protein [Anaerosacchariphilus polymeriproducens]|uniref:Uncharacterized protein n=1 Tax=Anaerosacchariphilus polymeriproducens TaxID=1812858 RepID=A0A371AZQ4_9FIRM|nr:hypothetical protein [Anaerosacchariphilus polymeriproducens]RDU25084.1 hypothetical protein DWV06_00875 [Anaerosacchariphilus polymeriproducens]
MKLLLSEEVFSRILIGILGLGIVCKIWWTFLYLRLVKETDNMNKTKSTQLRALMLQFEKKYQIKKGIQNIELFVDKHVNQMKVCGFHMQNANRISLSLAMISLIFSCVCGWWSYRGNGQIVQALQYLIEGVLIALILCGIHFIYDFDNQRENIIVNIQEYLENVFINKLEINNRQVVMTEKDKSDSIETEETDKTIENLEESMLFKELLEEIFP